MWDPRSASRPRHSSETCPRSRPDCPFALNRRPLEVPPPCADRQCNAAVVPATGTANMEPKKGKIGVWGLLVIGFFWVHGGIYGNEAMLMAAPPVHVFVMLGLVPFVYSLPIALIVAELSTAFPEDGGYVVWVREACGQVIGSLAGLLLLLGRMLPP